MARIETDDTVSLSTTTPTPTPITTNSAIPQSQPGISVMWPIFKFNCNRPFMFMIHDQKINEILFAGIYRG